MCVCMCVMQIHHQCYPTLIYQMPNNCQHCCCFLFDCFCCFRIIAPTRWSCWTALLLVGVNWLQRQFNILLYVPRTLKVTQDVFIFCTQPQLYYENSFYNLNISVVQLIWSAIAKISTRYTVYLAMIIYHHTEKPISGTALNVYVWLFSGNYSHC